MNDPTNKIDFPPGRSTVFLFLFTNISLLVGVAILWLIVWVAVSVTSSNWLWFSRSGSVLGILGGVLSARPVLRFTSAQRVRIRNMSIVETFTPKELKDQERDSAALIFGVILLVTGTLVWAYGDLLQKLWP